MSCTRFNEGRLQKGAYDGKDAVQTRTILLMISGAINTAEAIFVSAPMARMYSGVSGSARARSMMNRAASVFSGLSKSLR